MSFDHAGIICSEGSDLMRVSKAVSAEELIEFLKYLWRSACQASSGKNVDGVRRHFLGLVMKLGQGMRTSYRQAQRYASSRQEMRGPGCPSREPLPNVR